MLYHDKRPWWRHKLYDDEISVCAIKYTYINIGHGSKAEFISSSFSVQVGSSSNLSREWEVGKVGKNFIHSRWLLWKFFLNSLVSISSLWIIHLNCALMLKFNKKNLILAGLCYMQCGSWLIFMLSLPTDDYSHLLVGPQVCGMASAGLTGLFLTHLRLKYHRIKFVHFFLLGLGTALFTICSLILVIRPLGKAFAISLTLN